MKYRTDPLCSVLLIAAISTYIAYSLIDRTYYLRRKRNELVESVGYKELYTSPGGYIGKEKKSPSPSKTFLIAIWTMSALGAIIS
jgi:hypothetical protein